MFSFCILVKKKILGFPVALTIALFKISEVIAIYTGLLLGLKELSKFMTSKLALIPGISLILVGVWQIIG